MSTTPLNDALKPCPFCGSLPVMNELVPGKYWHLGCGNVLHSASVNSWESAEDAIAAWNTRANTPESSAAQGAMDRERKYATELAIHIWRNHYKAEAPHWKPLDDLEGVLSQIDNMTTGMCRKPSDATAQPSDLSQLRRFACFENEDGVYEDAFGSYVMFRDVEKLLANTAQGKPELPRVGADEYDQMIDLIFKERNYPCSPTAAARCGYEAANRFIALAAKKG